MGHQHLLKRLKDTASQGGMLSGVLTFVNHPRTVLVPGTCVQFITSVNDRLALLESTGVDMVIPLTFELELSRLRAHEFAELKRLTPREREVLSAMAEGLSNKGIADKLVVSQGAVEKHIGNVLAKLDLEPTEEAHRRVLAVLAYLEG